MWEIGVLIAAIAFAVLVVFLVTFIQSAKRSLAETNETLVRVRHDLEMVSKQSTELISAGEQLVREVDEKIRSFDPIVRSVKHTGEALEQVTASVKQVSAAVSRSAATIEQSVDRNQNRFVETVDYVSLGLHLWQKWNARKKKKVETIDPINL